MYRHIKNRKDWDGKNKLENIQYELQLVENRCVEIMNAVTDIDTFSTKSGRDGVFSPTPLSKRWERSQRHLSRPLG